jgi:MFS family permease
MLTTRIAAPPERVLAAAEAPIKTGFAEPTRAVVEDHTIKWSSDADLVDGVERVAEVTSDGAGGARLTWHAEVDLRLPYFGWLYRPFVRSALRKSLAHMAAVLEARALGRPEPPPPARPVWLTREPIEPRRAATIASVAMILIIAGYGGGIFTNTLDFVAESFDASDADLGVALAVTRVGTFIGLIGSAMADRRGRRRILLAAMIGVCGASAASAVAPGLVTFTMLQVIVRGCYQLAAVVGYIAVTEEAPEGSRAFLLAIAGMASGAGFALGAGLLPIADLTESAWRFLFVLAGLGLLLLPSLSRRLVETDRYAAISERARRARAKELVDPLYGGRFAVVGAVVFMLGFFGVPSLQFTNRYLQDDRGFSGIGIFVLRAITQALPSLFAIIAGGRLAESRGRKPVAARATFVLALATAAFFLWGGASLWIAMLVATVAGAMSGPSLTAFNTELFPTEVRGRAGAALLATGVVGAVSGLLFVGYLSDPLGGVGNAIALTCVVPLIVSLFLIPRLPEGRGRALDELSPPEV